MSLQTWELLSYVVTVVGLPLAILVFFLEQRKERDNEEQGTYQLLCDSYTDFLKLVLENPDLKLRSSQRSQRLSEEQRERRLVLFDLLAFRAGLPAGLCTPNEPRAATALEFRDALPGLLAGEDSNFAGYILRLAREEGQATDEVSGSW